MLTITRHEEFEMAHILTGYKGGCGNLHGHSYKIEVTVSGPQDPNHFDMIMDFKDLKSAIKKVIPDHKFVYNGLSLNTGNVEDELVKVLNVDKRDIVKYNFATTAENMVQYFVKEIEAPEGFQIDPDVYRVDMSGKTIDIQVANYPIENQKSEGDPKKADAEKNPNTAASAPLVYFVLFGALSASVALVVRRVSKLAR